MERTAMNEQTVQPQLCKQLPHPSGVSELGGSALCAPWNPAN